MSVVGVAEAAEVLGVSERRVRQMLADGALDGRRVGRAWVIEADALRSARNRGAESGRRWSSRSAWAVIALALDHDVGSLSPVERSRARQRLGRGWAAIAGRLEARAELRSFYAHPGVFDRLGDSDGFVVGGARAGIEHGVDVVAGPELEGYIRSGDLDVIAKRFGLEADASRPNLFLRVVDNDVWLFGERQRVADKIVAGLDMFGSGDPRFRRAGAALLESAQ